MSVPLVSRHKANLVSLILFLVGAAGLYLTGYVIQGVPLIIGLVVLARQIIRGRLYDTGVTLFVFTGTFLSYALNNDWPIYFPVFFGTAACYLVLREFLVEKERVGLDELEDQNQEIEEQQHDRDEQHH